MPRDKLRIRFRKAGDLRLISHHDLMRCFERMLRRADLPFHSTEGFNPKPRMAFALSLGLGIVGCHEVVELELDNEVDPQEVIRKLAEQAPAGLVILEVKRVDPKAKAAVRKVTYRIHVHPENITDLCQRITDLSAAPEWWVERDRPRRARVDIRPYLREFRLVGETLEIDIQMTPNGTGRPGEVLRLLGLHELLDSGAILERTALHLVDETKPESEADPRDREVPHRVPDDTIFSSQMPAGEEGWLAPTAAASPHNGTQHKGTV